MQKSIIYSENPGGGGVGHDKNGMEIQWGPSIKIEIVNIEVQFFSEIA